MSYDLFVSYSRQDNQGARITELVERIKKDFVEFSGRPLNPFFDITEIQGMQDWRLHILQGIRESRLMLACLSPSYLKSEYCEWEFNEYLKHEVDRSHSCEGVAPIYFVEVPAWENKGFEKECAEWVAELRRRHYFDLRPWFHEGEESLRDAAVEEMMHKLNTQLWTHINRVERVEQRLGNMYAHNYHFIGRTTELRRLRKAFVSGRLGVFTAVNGLGGVGKTALAIEYAHAYAHKYGGGCWLVRCEGKEDLCAAIAELTSPLGVELSEDEKKDTDRQYDRVLAELRRLSDTHEPHCCLLLLDNVDKPKFLEPAQTQRLPFAEWFHVYATTRLGAYELNGTHPDRSFLTLDELSESDALELIQTYLPEGTFPNETERDAAREIINLLGRFTLAVETAAVYLGQFADDVTCVGFLDRLKKEGLAGLDAAAEQSSEGVRHGEKRLTITLIPTLERLTEPERLTLTYAALLPADHIVLSWIRKLVAQKFPEFDKNDNPGYSDPWESTLRRLLSLRLLQKTVITADEVGQSVVSIHRLVGEAIQQICLRNIAERIATKMNMTNLLFSVANEFASETRHPSFWELSSLYESSLLWLRNGQLFAKEIAALCSVSLKNAGRYSDVLHLAEAILDLEDDVSTQTPVSRIWCHNMAGISSLYLGDPERAEAHFKMTRSDLGAFNVIDRDRLDVLTNFGCLYRETYRPLQALDLLKEALSVSEGMYGTNSKEVGTCCANLGLTFQDLCDINQAIQLLRRAVEIGHRTPGSTLRLCQDLASLSEALRNKGEDDESRSVALKALNLVEQKGYSNHPVSALCKTTLAGILEDGDELQTSRDLLESALLITEQCYGKKSPHIAACINNLGMNSLRSGELKDAIKKFTEALEIEQRGKKPRPLKLAHRKLNLGIALLLDGKANDACVLIASGWRYISETHGNSILSARLLLIRYVIGIVRGEPYSLFLEQLSFLFSEMKLISPGVAIRWSAEESIRKFVNDRFAGAAQSFEWGCVMIKRKARVMAMPETQELLQPEKTPLTVPWPDN